MKTWAMTWRQSASPASLCEHLWTVKLLLTSIAVHHATGATGWQLTHLSHTVVWLVYGAETRQVVFVFLSCCVMSLL